MICSSCCPLKILTLQFCKCNISESITAIGFILLQRDYYKPTKRSNEKRMQIDCDKTSMQGEYCLFVEREYHGLRTVNRAYLKLL